MTSIIERIDTVSDSGVELIPLQHASAAEVARTLNQLNEKNADPLESSRITWQISGWFAIGIR